jgi:hypothetical protein
MGMVEGSETNSYGVDHTMKRHERITPLVGDDIVRAALKNVEMVIKQSHDNKTVDVYLMNTSATGGYLSTDWALLGFTGLEKTLTRVQERYRKEAKFPRVEVFVKTLRKGLTLQFDLSNYNEDLISVFAQGTKSSLGAATGTRIAHGTSEPALEYRTFRLAATREDGKHYIIDVVKGEVSIGETTLGGETESVLPLTLSAIYNGAADATASLYTELLLESSLNATAIAPGGY